MPSQPAHIRDLQRESLRQLAGNGKIEGPGVRSLERLIDSPGNGLAEGWRRLGEGSGRRRLKKLLVSWTEDRNLVDVGDARHVGRIIVSGETTGILYGGCQA